MDPWTWALVGTGAVLALYCSFVLVLLVLGRGRDARALAGFVPDCLVLVGRLLKEPQLSRREKLPLGLLLVYLALPFDLIPDFIPIAGQLDDVILAAWVLRRLGRSAGPELIAVNWPGPINSLAVVLRLSGLPAPGLA